MNSLTQGDLILHEKLRTLGFVLGVETIYTCPLESGSLKTLFKINVRLFPLTSMTHLFLQLCYACYLKETVDLHFLHSRPINRAKTEVFINVPLMYSRPGIGGFARKIGFRGRVSPTNEVFGQPRPFGARLPKNLICGLASTRKPINNWHKLRYTMLSVDF